METNAMEVKNLSFSYGSNQILSDISLTIPRGKITTIMGANGCGKSTLFSLMTKNLTPGKGKILLEEKSIKKYSLSEFARKVSIVHQHNSAAEDITIERLVSYGRTPYQKMLGGKSEEDERLIEQALQVTGLLDLRDREIGRLSGGQRQRVWIAMALAQNTELLFLDEPTTGLDPATRRLVWESIDRMRIQNQMTVFLTTHYMEEAARAQHIAIMDGGKIKEVGTPFDLKEKYAEDTLRLIPVQDKERELTEALQGHSYQKVQEAYHLQVAKSMDALPVLARVKPYINGFEMIQGTMDDVFLNITGKILGTGSGEGL